MIKKWAYYNEINPDAAQWIRNLIAKGLVAPGEVDERSIEDVTPEDVRGFVQCHWFAGVAVWSYALRQAGWPDDRPIWTGSCPCQPFSTAGEGAGFADERHLWPAWFHLIQHGKSPSVPIYGEQVASDDGLTWLDLVQADLEGAGYSFRAVDICAAGVGSPNIRQRFFFHAEPDGISVGHTIGKGLEGYRGDVLDRNEPGRVGAVEVGSVATASDPHGLADTGHDECVGRDALRGADEEYDGATGQGEGAGAERERPEHDPAVRSTGNGVADADSERLLAPAIGGLHDAEHHPEPRSSADHQRPGPVNGFWRASDWLWCKDASWRPVRPGTFPLVARVATELGRGKSTLGGMARSNRVIRLKGYGNGINAKVATGFIKSTMS